MNKITLKPGKDRSLFRYHPWIFSGAIARIEGDIQEGDLVKVYNAQNQYMATGHYQIGSIAVRILTFEEKEIDRSFWKERISQAYALRRAVGLIGNPDNNVYRLVHGEGDNLPGLVIDIYAGVAVTQFHSVGMYLQREIIAETLLEVMGGSSPPYTINRNPPFPSKPPSTRTTATYTAPPTTLSPWRTA